MVRSKLGEVIIHHDKFYRRRNTRELGFKLLNERRDEARSGEKVENEDLFQVQVIGVDFVLPFWIVRGMDFFQSRQSWVHKFCDEISRSDVSDINLFLDSYLADFLFHAGANEACGSYFGANLECQLDLWWIRHFV